MTTSAFPPSPPSGATAPSGAPASEPTERVRQIVADVFQLEVGQVPATATARDIDRWDSVNHLNLVLALESEFHATFSPEEIDHLDSVEAIVRTLEKRRLPAAPRPAPSTGEPVIRRLGPDDLPAVAALLDQRDGVHYDPGAVGRYLCDLDPRRLLGWIALDGQRPVGLTVLYLRPLIWDGQILRAGYWSHLFVHGEFRRQLVYSRLVHAMMEEAPAAGVDLIYTGTRRPAVAEGHVKMGFTALGTVGVRAKPLRPFALLASYRGWQPLAGMGRVLDPLYRLSARLGGRPPSYLRIEATDSASPHLAGLLEMLVRGAGPRVRQAWTPESWRLRFAATLEGWPYTLLLAFEGQRLRGGLLLRSALRPAPTTRALIPLGIVLDLVAPPGETAVATALLAEAEGRALAQGCLAMLWLGGVAELEPVMNRLGYRPSADSYRILVWPSARLSSTPNARSLSQWRFPFAEHDAF